MGLCLADFFGFQMQPIFISTSIWHHIVSSFVVMGIIRHK